MHSISPYYITGLVETDGSFVVTFDKNSRNRYGLRAVPKFYITQYQSEESDILFKKIQQYFGCGHITASRYDNCYYYIISSRQQLLDKILPHFDKYPLKSTKHQSYQIFKRVIQMQQSKQHITREGLAKIIELCYDMNPAGVRRTPKIKLLHDIGWSGPPPKDHNVDLIYPTTAPL